MSTNFYEEIIYNYKKLYEIKEEYDAKIYVGEKKNIKEFHVHSFILKIQSKFFKTAFTEDVQKKDGYYILNSNNSPKVFEILLRYLFNMIFKNFKNEFFLIFSFFLLQSYMYCGSINLTNLQSREILNLLLPSDDLAFQLF